MTDELMFGEVAKAEWNQAVKFFDNGYGVSVLKATEDSKRGFAGVYATAATEEQEETFELAILCGGEDSWTLVEDIKVLNVPYDGVYSYITMDEVGTIMEMVSNLERIPV